MTTACQGTRARDTIEPLTTVDVKSNVGGRVDVLAVDVGDSVKKGQLIARIDPTDTNTQFAQAQADYQADQARLDQAQTNLQLQREQTQAAISQARQQLAAARTRRNRICHAVKGLDSIGPRAAHRPNGCASVVR